MARSFDGANTMITATITDISAAPLTFGCWAFANTAGETSNGRIIRTEITGGTGSELLVTTGPVLKWTTNSVTTNATATASTAFTASQWWATFGTLSSGQLPQLFQGSQSAKVAECAYTTQTTGVGGQSTGVNGVCIGNKSDQTLTFDGRIAHVCIWQRQLSLAEMELFRCGIILRTGLYAYWPLTSPTTSQIEELVANRTGTWTAGTGAVVENPPFHMRLENWT